MAFSEQLLVFLGSFVFDSFIFFVILPFLQELAAQKIKYYKANIFSKSDS